VALNTLALMLHNQGEDDRARMLLQESLGIFRELNLMDGIAYDLDLLGVLRISGGDYSRARTLHEESLAIHRRCQALRRTRMSNLSPPRAVTSTSDGWVLDPSRDRQIC